MPETPEERCQTCGRAYKIGAHIPAVAAARLEAPCADPWHDAPPQPDPGGLEAARREYEETLEAMLEIPKVTPVPAEAKLLLAIWIGKVRAAAVTLESAARLAGRVEQAERSLDLCLHVPAVERAGVIRKERDRLLREAKEPSK